MKISARYNWLANVVGLPKMVLEAIKIGKLDTTEFPGAKSNPEIMALAFTAGVANIYKSDETAWCAVAQCAIALMAGKVVAFKSYDRLRAKSFMKFGTKVNTPMMGDTLVFERPGGFHVGIYIAEDSDCYHVAGGNQGNQYSIVRIDKERLSYAGRPEYKTGTPAAVRQFFVDGIGQPSKNES
jgi:uncharacterized protein (TIGR02594 family)